MERKLSMPFVWAIADAPADLVVDRLAPHIRHPPQAAASSVQAVAPTAMRSFDEPLQDSMIG